MPETKTDQNSGQNLARFAAIAAGLALLLSAWTVVRSLSAVSPSPDAPVKVTIPGDEEPITIAGGSLRIRPGGWEVTGNKATYQSDKPITFVRYTCDLENDSEGEETIKVTSDFKITLKYGPEIGTLSQKILFDYVSSKLSAYVKKIGPADPNGKDARSYWLRSFLGLGQHRTQDWHILDVKFENLGKVKDPCPQKRKQNFFLEFSFKP